ncbi:hypothetical protein A6E05_01440 [Aliivibrio sp. 1S165]|uniref:hypothetical protein n=1 Tax=unclassified Aliivibrio TaxID=2645654 RepID=UPI00080DB93D|nr:MULTISPECIES: hypothetical protein [unclassified Aliivibrio]OCH19042.1 hypothetical protein A6E05_01440 [Aliivibrio sp. 1S165]OCH30764.1 hypothetical protein A6E06_04070 [Aliivibrio sp. 1S175]
MIRKILLVILTLILLVVAAGIYRFNFTNDDIYVVQTDDQVVPFDITNNVDPKNNVMLMLFSFDIDRYWQIQLPDSEAKAPLTDLREYDDLHLATGKYQDGDEHGLVSLDYYNITPLHLGNIDDEMVFSAPFSVSNQGTGTFWYLGLFNLNTNTGEIGQIDTFFLGDRIKVNELKTDEPFDVTSSLYVSYFKHDQKQSMAEIPSERVDQYIKVSIEGFQDKP